MMTEHASLEFLLARSIQMGAACTAAGAAITRARRKIADGHKRVTRAARAVARYRFEQVPAHIEAEHRRALEAWFTLSTAALGLDERAELPAPTRSDEEPCGLFALEDR